MNKLEEQLSEVLKKSLDLAEQTGEFVMDQAPDLLQQFFLWHTTRLSLLVIVGLSVLIFAYWLHSKWKTNENYYDEGPCFIVFLIALAGFVSFIASTFQLVKILIAPKIYLIDYFIQ